jgi:hypothetical protein
MTGQLRFLNERRGSTWYRHSNSSWQKQLLFFLKIPDRAVAFYGRFIFVFILSAGAAVGPAASENSPFASSEKREDVFPDHILLNSNGSWLLLSLFLRA